MISDAELATLALTADPDAPIDPDAVPFTLAGHDPDGLLPAWYMPAPQLAARPTPRRVFAVGLVVGALLLLNGAGLCVTYGWPEVAW